MTGNWNSASSLLEMALRATVILGAAGLASLALRRASASLRHLVWVSALAGVLALPLASRLLPLWTVPVWVDLVPAPGAVLLRANAAVNERPATPVVEAAAARTAAAVPVGAPARPSRTFPLAALWLAGAGLLLLRAALGWAAALRLRWACRPAREEAASLARVLAAELGIARPVRVVEAAGAAMPVTWGLFRPVVVIPAGANPARLRVILTHELAHIARGDYFQHLVGQAACALYWFHPLVWLAQAEALRLRERAADDLVLATGLGASEYAVHLVGLARTLAAPRLCGSLAMARPSHLERRVRAILDPRVRRAALNRAGVAAGALAALALVAGVAAVRPVAAEVPPPQVREAAIPAAPDTIAEAEAQAARQDAAFDFDRAAAVYTRAAELRAARFGPQSVEYARGLVTLGAFYRTWDRYPEARDAFLKALPILVQALGPNSPELFEPVYFMALDAQAARDEPRAEQLFRRALELRRGAGLTDSKTALVLNALAALAAKAGDAAGSLRLLEEAQAAAADDAPESPAIVDNYAAALRKLGRESDADVAAARANQLRQSAARRASANAAPMPADPSIYRVGGGVVTAPSLIQKAEPEYSQEARVNHFQGTVVLAVVIEPDGVARDIRVTRPLGFGLDQKAVEAIRQWRFQPGTRNGQPVRVAATIEVNFRLL